MLTGAEILKQIELGNIIIEPFCKGQVNPNSYNLTLGDELSVYTQPELDSAKQNPTETIKIGQDGYVLQPGTLYIATTREHTETKIHVPQLSGRSSIGRVGLGVHMNAGLGAPGYSGKWNLGLTCIVPVKVYPGMQIGQIYYISIHESNT